MNKAKTQSSKPFTTWYGYCTESNEAVCIDCSEFESYNLNGNMHGGIRRIVSIDIRGCGKYSGRPYHLHREFAFDEITKYNEIRSDECFVYRNIALFRVFFIAQIKKYIRMGFGTYKVTNIYGVSLPTPEVLL